MIIAYEVEASQPRVDVQPGDAQGVVVVPEVSSWDVVVIAEFCGKSIRNICPLWADNLFLVFPRWTVEEFRVAIELVVCVTAVQVGDDRYTCFCDTVLGIAMQAVAPV